MIISVSLGNTLGVAVLLTTADLIFASAVFPALNSAHYVMGRGNTLEELLADETVLRIQVPLS